MHSERKIIPSRGSGRFELQKEMDVIFNFSIISLLSVVLLLKIIILIVRRVVYEIPYMTSQMSLPLTKLFNPECGACSVLNCKIGMRVSQCICEESVSSTVK